MLGRVAEQVGVVAQEVAEVELLGFLAGHEPGQHSSVGQSFNPVEETKLLRKANFFGKVGFESIR